MKLDNKVAFVTGAGQGIGKAIAMVFAQEGAKVVAVDRKDTVKETASEITKAGGHATAFVGDMSQSKDVQSAVDAAVKEHGRIDILVNNAGVELHGIKTPMETTEEQWDYHMNNNLKSYFLTSKFVAPHMVKNGGGSIVNIASLDGLYGWSNEHAAYNTSQAGRTMLTKVMARNLGRQNIRVNAICPTSVADTGIYAVTPEKEAAAKAQIPLGRVAKKEEVARLAAFLASDEVPYLNGAIIVLDGGQSA
ncbi:MAG TPA: glucose 1-dehydrogenase [Nitrososphaerales archaeon]|nr:glucose 1-dehydrogenase [Nitrososphaerales archaeon]